jgi:hypothetical protein
MMVNELLGIYWLKGPHPGLHAVALTLVGCALATIGGILLGNLK